MPKRTVFLTGAPTLRSLCWNEAELLDTPVPPFRAEGAVDQHGERLTVSQDPHPVKWRLLQNQKVLEQPYEKSAMYNENTLFFTTHGVLATSGTPIGTSTSTTSTATTTTQDIDDSDLSQFYDHSFAVYEGSTVSASGLLPGDSMRESGSWADSTENSVDATNDGDTLASGYLPIQGHLTELEGIPNARYLRSIVPQTMTVNLVAGVITAHPARRVVTRQWRKELDLVEVVVGDETRAGFGVTFWLSPGEDNDGLGKTISGLRPRDIVLLRMVALSSFRERVYGQSLRRGVTKVDLLHRQPVDPTDMGGIYSLKTMNNHAATKDDLLLMKARKVREWIVRFVGYYYPTDSSVGGGDHGKKNLKHGRRGMLGHPGQTDLVLPPDTQQ